MRWGMVGESTPSGKQFPTSRPSTFLVQIGTQEQRRKPSESHHVRLSAFSERGVHSALRLPSGKPGGIDSALRFDEPKTIAGS
jgi:hypothetical protein